MLPISVLGPGLLVLVDDPSCVFADAWIRVFEKPLDLGATLSWNQRPAWADHPVDVPHGLPVLQLFRLETCALPANVTGVTAAGKALVREMGLTAPAEVSPLATPSRAFATHREAPTNRASWTSRSSMGIQSSSTSRNP